MSFFEFLGAAGDSSLSGMTFFDIFFATGLFGMVSFLLGMTAVAFAVVGLVVRPFRWLPLILGVLSFLLALLGANSGYMMAAMNVSQSGGWENADPAEIADAAALTMFGLYIGLGGLCLGIFGSVVNIVAAKIRARSAFEQEPLEQPPAELEA